MPNGRIALIEVGGKRLGLMTKVPGTAFIASSFAHRNWNFETEPVAALNGRKLSWFQGRILGGSSSINGMLYLPGHSFEYDQWAQLGCHGWSFDQVLPYFKKAETNTRGANEWHGDSGPIPVKPSHLTCQSAMHSSPLPEWQGSLSSMTSIRMLPRALAGSIRTSPTAGASARR
jgi:choline dehydrogenase-like flavoprotein